MEMGSFTGGGGGRQSRAVEFGTAEYGLAGGPAAGGEWRCDLRPAARRDDLLHRTVVRPPGADLETRGYLTGWHRRWSLGRFSGLHAGDRTGYTAKHCPG